MMKKIGSLLLCLSLLIGLCFNFFMTLAICLGAIWGAINLYFIKQVLQKLLIKTPNNNHKLLFFTFIKFPLLYGAGYGLLLVKQLSPWALLIGFTLVLISGVLGWYWQSLNLKKV